MRRNECPVPPGTWKAGSEVGRLWPAGWEALYWCDAGQTKLSGLDLETGGAAR